MKFLLLKPDNKIQLIEKRTMGLKTIKEVMGLEDDNPIDCIERAIGSTYYDFYVDDEALLKDDKQVTAINKPDGQELIAGPILIARVNDEGKTIGLTQEEIDNIMNRGGTLVDKQEIKKLSDLPEDAVLHYGIFGPIKIGTGTLLLYKLDTND